MNYSCRLFLGLTESPTTYNVRCLHESGPNSIIYRASFFTSEVDKVNTKYTCGSYCEREYEQAKKLLNTTLHWYERALTSIYNKKIA